MKLFKLLLIILSSLFVLFLIITVFLPSKYSVTRSIKINAPAMAVFDEVNTLKNWEKWSPWLEMDPRIKITYTGPECGSGACYSWESTNQRVGSGKFTITESQPYSFINARVDFPDATTTSNPCEFKESNGTTEVTQSIKGDLGFFERWPGLWMESSIGPMLEQGLTNLKTITEKKSHPNVQISVTSVEPQTVLIINETTSMDPKEISAVIQKDFGEIAEFIRKNKLDVAGPPMAINESYEGGKYVFDVGIPIRTTSVKTNGRIKLQTTLAGKVVKGVAVGPYEQADAYYKAMDSYIKVNKLQVRGKPWEVYVSDPHTTPSEKVVTHIYYPIYVPE